MFEVLVARASELYDSDAENVRQVSPGHAGSRTSCPPAGEARSDSRKESPQGLFALRALGGQDVRDPAALPVLT